MHRTTLRVTLYMLGIYAFALTAGAIPLLALGHEPVYAFAMGNLGAVAGTLVGWIAIPYDRVASLLTGKPGDRNRKASRVTTKAQERWFDRAPLN